MALLGFRRQQSLTCYGAGGEKRLKRRTCINTWSLAFLKWKRLILKYQQHCTFWHLLVGTLFSLDIFTSLGVSVSLLTLQSPSPTSLSADIGWLAAFIFSCPGDCTRTWSWDWGLGWRCLNFICTSTALFIYLNIAKSIKECCCDCKCFHFSKGSMG